jgi:asparagine synthase (glutamine-hydrolysing)
MKKPIARVLDLIDPASQRLDELGVEEARQLLLSEDPEAVASIAGSFALVARDGERVRLARSLDRPLRYFLAKEESGPMLIVGERIDQIAAALEAEGYGDQFHPSYTRMAPAHHVTTLRLIGCPDPNPVYERFFTPPMGTLPADPHRIGEQYIGALYRELSDWLDRQDDDEPIGVLFSGGVDSGSVLLCLYHRLLATGRSPSRLKAFTLSVDGGGGDAGQAREFLRATELEMLGEEIAIDASKLDPMAAVELIEDYKARDVECATVNLALLEAVRRRYPEWRLVVDGDGGDENLKDYPIEENPELTIVSVVNNPMLYQEGWGVGSIKHSLVYSGGYSRGCVRTWAPAARFGFESFSPYTRPKVVATAEAIPFRELTEGSHEKLYSLKGEVVRAGVAAVTGIDMPVFEKRRFQEGAVADRVFEELFAAGEAGYRDHFNGLHAALTR